MDKYANLPLHGSQLCHGKGACITHEAMSHVVQGYPRQMGHNGQF